MVTYDQQFSFADFGLDQTHSMSALHTAIQAKFLKSSSAVIDECKDQLLSSVDNLKLSKLPNSARSF